MTADTLASAKSLAFENLRLSRPAVPLGKSVYVRYHIPNLFRRRSNAPLPEDLDHFRPLRPNPPELLELYGMPNQSPAEQFDTLYGRVKSLERRGLLTRRRDPNDERRLAIVLTRRGVARLRSDSILDLVRLGAALKKLTPAERKSLFEGLDRLAPAAPIR